MEVLVENESFGRKVKCQSNIKFWSKSEMSVEHKGLFEYGSFGPKWKFSRTNEIFEKLKFRSKNKKNLAKKNEILSNSNFIKNRNIAKKL